MSATVVFCSMVAMHSRHLNLWVDGRLDHDQLGGNRASLIGIVNLLVQGGPGAWLLRRPQNGTQFGFVHIICSSICLCSTSRVRFAISTTP